MGVGGTNRKDWNQLGLHMLANNYDDEQIRSWLGANLGLSGGGDVRSGNAAQINAHLQETFSNYGVSFTQKSLDGYTKQILSGGNTLEGLESLARSRAKATYAHLAPQIDAGMTIRDIADPYIATYAQTLELPETGVKLSDRAIQAALQVKDPKTGAFSNQPMHEFQRALKNDPRWDATQNAQTEAYAMVNRLGADFGFLS
jgi:hypothetical protein